MLLAVNWLAVVGAAFASLVIWYLWYLLLFRGVWRRLRNKDFEQQRDEPFPPDKYVLQLIAALLEAFMLAQFIGWAMVLGVAGGVVLGFWVWLGFYATQLFMGVLWRDEPWELFAFDAAERLLALLTMAAILTAWR